MNHNPRLQQLVKKCKTRGGDCPCVGVCKADEELSVAIARLKAKQNDIASEIRFLENQKQQVNTPPATLKSGWNSDCPSGWEPVMIASGGPEWIFGYENPENDDWQDASDWPFEELYIWPDDCERNGIRVE